MDAPIVGAIGGTFGGNPLACASALAVFDLLETTPILQRAQDLAIHLRNTFARWQGQFEIIGDVRGLGPMQGLELVKSRKSKEPHPDAAKAWAKFALEHGVIVMSSGTHGNVIRFLLPLTIQIEELNEGLAVLEQGLGSLP
jgi:4-aminobutyrate aminotransferase/(S)-3-amino-2-methylpropionate transaminase